MNSKSLVAVTTFSLVCAALIAGTAFAQAGNPLAFGYAHGTASFVGGPTASEGAASETVLAFTSATGVRQLAVADRKGDYRLPLESGKYCVSAYDSRGNPLQLSSPEPKCIDVSASKDVRLDVTISRTVAAVNAAPSRTIEPAGEIDSQVLAGRVVDGAGAPIPEVLLERLSADGKRVEAVFTNSNGRFVMKQRDPWVYAVRVSKPGFDTLLLKVRVSKNGKRELALTLPASH